MALRLKKITGEEFIRKLLDGERDFSYVALQPQNGSGKYYPAGWLKYDFNCCENMGGQASPLDALRSDNLRSNPVILTGSDFSCIRAHGIYLPHVRAIGTDFRNSSFWGADFKGGTFENANFGGAILERADLQYTGLAGTIFTGVDLRKSLNLSPPELAQARLKDAIVTPELAEQIQTEYSKLMRIKEL